jgi:hypothetical protein
VKLDILQLESGKQECENIKKSLTLAMINEDNPNDKWTHVFTDGSATRAIKGGGAGILIIHPSSHRVTQHMTTGKHCSNFRAETEALMKAVSMIIDSSEAVSSVVFLTDARSALINNKPQYLARAMIELSTICNGGYQHTVAFLATKKLIN